MKEPLTVEQVQNQLELIIKVIKKTSFVSEYTASNEEAIAMMISKFFEWDGLAILKTMRYALEDANFHTEASVVDTLIEKVK